MSVSSAEFVRLDFPSPHLSITHKHVMVFFPSLVIFPEKIPLVEFPIFLPYQAQLHSCLLISVWFGITSIYFC